MSEVPLYLMRGMAEASACGRPRWVARRRSLSRGSEAQSRGSGQPVKTTHQVVLHKPIPPKICQLILYYYSYTE